MQISPEQLAELERESNESFHDRMITHLRKCFPDQCGRRPNDELRAFIVDGQANAATYGFTAERDVCKFIDISVVHGTGFHHAPWAATILKDGLYRTPTARLERLFEAALVQPVRKD